MSELAPKLEQEEEQEGFVINDDNKACWALKKIKKYQEEISDKEALAKSQIKQIKDWKEEEVGKREKKINNLTAMLEEYGRELKKLDPDLKTHSLPFGELKFRAQQPEYEYDDEKLLEFLRTTSVGVIRVKEQVDKKALKQFTKVVGDVLVHAETGEVIEGVKIIERDEKFNVKVK